MVNGYNKKSIGVCVVGDFDIEQPPPEQIERVIELILYLIEKHNIDLENVRGHREIDTRRSCPGKMFSMYNLRAEIKRRLLYGAR